MGATRAWSSHALPAVVQDRTVEQAALAVPRRARISGVYLLYLSIQGWSNAERESAEQARAVGQAAVAGARPVPRARRRTPVMPSEREFLMDNLLVRIHFIIEKIRWTGLAPWEFEFPLSGSLVSTFLAHLWYLYSSCRRRSPHAARSPRSTGNTKALQGHLAHKKHPPSLGSP